MMEAFIRSCVAQVPALPKIIPDHLTATPVTGELVIVDVLVVGTSEGPRRVVEPWRQHERLCALAHHDGIVAEFIGCRHVILVGGWNTGYNLVTVIGGAAREAGPGGRRVMC